MNYYIKNIKLLDFLKYSYGLFAFILPIYPKLAPIIIALITIFTFLGYFGAKLLIRKQNISILIYSTFPLYLLYLLGLLYSANINYGMRDIETKLSLGIFPILVLFIQGEREIIRFCFRNFIYGCGFALALCLSHSSWLFIIEKLRESKNLYSEGFGIDNFFSAKFGFLVHPTYLAWYFVSAIIILWMTNSFGNYFLKSIATVILILGVFLSGSRFGLVALTFGIIYFGFVTVKSKIPRKYFLVSLIITSSLFVVAVISSVEVRSRIISPFKIFSEQHINPLSEDGTVSRVLVWDSAIEKIISSPFVGYGTGDVKDVLIQKYKENGYFGVYKKQLNAHNQFLQTSLALGIVGLFILIFLLLRPVIFRKNYSVLFLFSMVSSITFLFESSLEVQTGTMFFGAFYSLIFTYDNLKIFA